LALESGAFTVRLLGRLSVVSALVMVGTACSESAAPRPIGLPSTDVILLEDLSARQVFPASNWWNLDISAAPVDPQSRAMIDWISGRTAQNPTATRNLHPDFGPPPFGIPYVGVGANQALVQVDFSPYGSESDPGAPGRPSGYPIPAQARAQPNFVEGAEPGGGSNALERGRRTLGGGVGSSVRSVHQHAPAGRLDLGRRRRARDLPRSRAPRRGGGLRAHHTRLPRHGARDERLRLAGLTPGREHRGRPADGRTAPSQGVGRHERLPA
jgi:hypothetical protein